MEVIKTVDGEAVKEFATNNITKGSEVRTDGLSIYKPLAAYYKLNQKVYDPKNQPEHLHWLHIIISDAKALIDGTFHGLDKKHLQRYLDEFCYRFNRRWFETGIFARLVSASVSAGVIRSYELIG